MGVFLRFPHTPYPSVPTTQSRQATRRECVCAQEQRAPAPPCIYRSRSPCRSSVPSQVGAFGEILRLNLGSVSDGPFPKPVSRVVTHSSRASGAQPTKSRETGIPRFVLREWRDTLVWKLAATNLVSMTRIVKERIRRSVCCLDEKSAWTISGGSFCADE